MSKDKDLGPIGPTGEFPEGKLNDDDEGALAVAVSIDQDNVVVNFGTPVVWFELPLDQAIAFAENIIEKAKKLKKTRQ